MPTNDTLEERFHKQFVRDDKDDANFGLVFENPEPIIAFIKQELREAVDSDRNRIADYIEEFIKSQHLDNAILKDVMNIIYNKYAKE